MYALPFGVTGEITVILNKRSSETFGPSLKLRKKYPFSSHLSSLHTVNEKDG